ncbi:aldo/keto reductase [Brevibacterium litoralis]|uniref:aldo/keto reductase n=1 Tax=Brevibacterium litoralis TaxID=3138935 RepID=UPI0032EC1322
MSSPAESLSAHSGLTLPTLGFGTYALRGLTGRDAIVGAIRSGYRLLDSAFNYENEGIVGAAVRRAIDDATVTRSDLVVTSKLPGRHHDHAAAIDTIEESVTRTGLGYIDLYLIHWPNPRVGKYVEAWKALIHAKERGLVRAIGVSNFLTHHLETLEKETGVVPEVNQIELHPYFPQVDLVAFNEAKGIITESWSPLGRGTDLLEEPVLAEVARAHEATPAQVVLAWHIARGALPIPKTANPDRREENLGAVALANRLDEAEVSAITSLGRPDGRRKDQDPAVYEEF